MVPEEAGPLREQEERDSALIVGVDTVEFLDFPDGVLEYGLPLRHDFAAAVRRHTPEVVITGNFQDSFGPGMLNQADHIAVGRAVLDAVRDAGNRWVFRDLLDQGLEPWGGVHTVLVSGSPKGQHAVNIDDYLEAGVRSLEAHAQYLAGLGGSWPPADEILESVARMFGPRLGCKYATGFEVISLRPPW